MNLYKFPDLSAGSVQARLKRVERTVQYRQRGQVADVAVNGSNFRTVSADSVDRDGNIIAAALDFNTQIDGRTSPLGVILRGLGYNGQLNGTFYNNPVNTQGSYTGANPLTQSGTSTLINVASSTQQFGSGRITYNSGSVDPGSYGTWYVYADDPHFKGGLVTYAATANDYDLTANNGRVFFGKVTTSAGGGGTGGGGGGGCPLSGAPVILYGDPGWWTKKVIPCEDFILLATETGRIGIFSPNDRRYCHRGLLALTEWRVGDVALTEAGDEQVTRVEPLHLAGASVDSYEATTGHIYSAYGFIGHNMKYSPE